MRAVLTSPLLRNVLLCACIALPWLNPFTSPPSTSVLPLLLSWMMAACALLLVADLPVEVTPHNLQSQPSKILRWAVGATAVWLLISLLYVPQVLDAGASMGLLAALTCIGVMAWVGRRIACQANQCMPWLVGAWLVAATVSSLLGVLQYLDMASSLSPWVNLPAYKGDAFANLRQRNQFASLTSVGLVALLVWSQRAKGWLAVLVLNVLAVGAACAMSRTGVLQWVLVSALALLWAWRQYRNGVQLKRLWWICAALAPVLLLLWSFLMPAMAQQVTGHTGGNLALRVAGAAQDYGVCASRGVLWSNVWQLILQKPVFGWGWGETDLAHFLTPYNTQRFCDILDNAHNLPLHLALELGVPFALSIMAMVGHWCVQRKPWQERNPSRIMAWGVLVVIGTHSLLEYPLWYGPFQMTFGLCIGLLWALPAPPSQYEPALNNASPLSLPSAVPNPHAAMHEAWSLTLASVFFIACLYAAWDFHRVSQIYKSPEQRDPVYSVHPLAYAKQSWLFRNQAAFAELTLQPVNASNAQAVYELAQRVVHFSPEARVVQPLIDSARLLGHDDEADHWANRLTAQQQSMQR